MDVTVCLCGYERVAVVRVVSEVTKGVMFVLVMSLVGVCETKAGVMMKVMLPPYLRVILVCDGDAATKGMKDNDNDGDNDAAGDHS